MRRRRLLGTAAGGAAAAALGLPLLGLGGCRARFGAGREPAYAGGWVGVDPARGHRLRDGVAGRAAGEPLQRRSAVLIVGAGIAGLACARALRQRGIDDVHLLELEDQAGGNSRGHAMAGMACPLGAHYLPIPGDRMPELVDLLAELGLMRQESGRRVVDERHRCHSPQERLFVADDARIAPERFPRVVWHEGLLPPIEALPPAERAAALADYRRFAALVRRQVDAAAFAMPTARADWSDELAALDAISFSSWLDRQGLRSAALRWYLDYCCRDDYGGGPAQVSAWAGLHYFASRHGFDAPGDDAPDDGGVLTWPEGNAWLSRRLAAPLDDRLHTGRSVTRVDAGRHEVVVDAWDHAAQRAERWTAGQVVLATPLFIAARLWTAPPPALLAVVARQRHAPWLVANLQLNDALVDRPGAPPSWDNVVYGSPSLGYVDAMHQSTRPHAGATVLTSYWALGGDDAAQALAARRALLEQPWEVWAERVIADLLPVHPDLRRKLERVDIARYGHAMSMPVPGLRGSPELAVLRQPFGRISLAHADLAGYSVFEEAFFHGHRVGGQLKV